MLLPAVKILKNRVEFMVKKSQAQVLFAVFFGAMLIDNFVFTKYLGLCIFFGSLEKDAAIGMGITFTIVMVLSAVMCWALFLRAAGPASGLSESHCLYWDRGDFCPGNGHYSRKVNPFLFKKLGVYLVLIVTNCIILAVPLINADSGNGPFASLTLGLGAGIGFALALFLMSCVREKLEVCRVPPTFQGLPIAFIVTGLFASGLFGVLGTGNFLGGARRLRLDSKGLSRYHTRVRAFLFRKKFLPVFPSLHTVPRRKHAVFLEVLEHGECLDHSVDRDNLLCRIRRTHRNGFGVHRQTICRKGRSQDRSGKGLPAWS